MKEENKTDVAIKRTQAIKRLKENLKYYLRENNNSYCNLFKGMYPNIYKEQNGKGKS